jgi:hypothetical protein
MEPRVRILAKHLTACLQKATEQGNGRTEPMGRKIHSSFIRANVISPTLGP